MARRLFNTEYKEGGIVEKWYSYPDGTIERELVQQSDGIIKAVKGIVDAGAHKGKDRYLLGSVPIVEAQLWAKECGHGIGTQDWLEYAKKKLMSNEFSNLATGVQI